MLAHDSSPRRRTETVDRYLETIYYIEAEGEVPRPGRLADWLGVRPPTVTSSLQRLARDGWIAIEADRRVRLTSAGRQAASAIVRRHRITERWLTDILGLDWAAADREAEALAHGLSDVVVDRLDRHLGHPSTCPHGNTIPGRDTSLRAMIRLPDLTPGLPARVERISEVAEHDAPQLLHLLFDVRVVPGALIVRREHPPGRVAVEVEGVSRQLPEPAARAVWVSETSLA